jgi:hypothetical protein
MSDNKTSQTIEPSIDTIGYQIRDPTDPNKLLARAYALRTESGYDLYELGRGVFPAQSLGSLREFDSVRDVLKTHLEARMRSQRFPLKTISSRT